MEKKSVYLSNDLFDQSNRWFNFTFKNNNDINSDIHSSPGVFSTVDNKHKR